MGQALFSEAWEAMNRLISILMKLSLKIKKMKKEKAMKKNGKQKSMTMYFMMSK